MPADDEWEHCILVTNFDPPGGEEAWAEQWSPGADPADTLKVRGPRAHTLAAELEQQGWQEEGSGPVGPALTIRWYRRPKPSP